MFTKPVCDVFVDPVGPSMSSPAGTSSVRNKICVSARAGPQAASAAASPIGTSIFIRWSSRIKPSRNKRRRQRPHIRHVLKPIRYGNQRVRRPR
jgi:hypothetical protein